MTFDAIHARNERPSTTSVWLESLDEIFGRSSISPSNPLFRRSNSPLQTDSDGTLYIPPAPGLVALGGQTPPPLPGEQPRLGGQPRQPGGLELCAFFGGGDNGGGDGGDRVRAVPQAARPMVHDLQRLLGTLVQSIDVRALSDLATHMSQAQRTELTAALRLVVAANLPDGRPRFTEEQRTALRASLNRGEFPPELLAHCPLGRRQIEQFLTTALNGERDRNEIGPVTRAMHQNVVGWLNRETQDLLRLWASQSTDLPPAGCPLRLPAGTRWQDVVARLRENTDASRTYINGLLQNSPLSNAVNFQPDTEAGRNQLQTSLSSIAGALQWRGAIIPQLESLLHISLGADTRQTLAWLAQQGLQRPGWAPTEGTDRRSWYAASGLHGEQARVATSIVQIILGLRAAQGGQAYPGNGHADPFGPDFPGTVTRGPGDRLDVRLNLPTSLTPTPESELYYQRLQRWTDANRFVLDDFMRMFENARRQFGLLSFANVPVTGRAPNNELYNLACPRFTTRRIGDQIEVTQTTSYYNSPWYNPHDIFGSAVHTESNPPFRVGLNDLVPVMSNGGLVLVRGADLHDHSSDFWSGAWRSHHGSRAVGIAFDVAMCLNAVTRVASIGALFRAGATAVQKEAAWLALRQGTYNALLGGSSFLTSSYWQNRELPWAMRILPDARNAWFMLDMVHNLPGALRTIGGVTPLVRRLPWIAGQATEAASATRTASALEEMMRASRWINPLDRTARLTSTAAEVGLVGMMAFGRHSPQGGAQAADIVRFGQGRNLEQASLGFLSQFVSNLSNGQRVAALDGIVESVRGYRPNMPAAERDQLLTNLTATVDRNGAPPRERITAAVALALVLGREQQDGNRQLTDAQTQQLNKAKNLLEQMMQNGQLSGSDRLACGQGLLLTGSITPHAYFNLCKQVAHDNNADQGVRQQAVFGMGVCLMLTRETERNIHDGGTRTAYLAQAFNTTSRDMEQELMALGGGQHNATDDMRVAAVSMMHALNRDDSGQAQQMLTSMFDYYRQHNQPGQFATHFAGTLRSNLTAAQPAQDTPENLRRWYENRLAAGGALNVLAADAALMQRLNCPVTQAQIRQNFVDVANGAILNPEVATQAILSLGNLQGLNAQQTTQIVDATDRILRMPVLNSDQALAATIMKESLLAVAPQILARASQAERTRLLDAISGMIDPARAGNDRQFAADSPELRVAAIKALEQWHTQQPLPAAMIRLIADRAGYRAQGGGGALVANDPSPQVRLAAFEALRRIGYGARETAGVNLNAIAEAWLANESDLALKMVASNWLDIARQQRVPERRQIDEAATAQIQIPRVSTPITSNANQVRQWLTSQFGQIITPALMPDGSLDGERPNRDPIQELLQVFDVRSPDVFGVRPDVNGRFRNTNGIVVSPQNAAVFRGAMASYINDLNRFFQLAQTNSGPESEQARQALFWVANGGWREFPERFRGAVAILSVEAIQQLATGQNSAQAREWLENLVESNQASPQARLIALNGLRDIRDSASHSSYQGRYTALLESVFSQLVNERPNANTAQGQQHYLLLQEIMHDLAFDSKLRSPYFVSRMEAFSRDNTVPTEMRRYANVCLGQLFAWSNATSNGLRDLPNPSGNTPLARAQHLDQAMRNPGSGDINLLEGIFNSVRGLPFASGDPRIPGLMGLIWTPSQGQMRAQIAACRAAFSLTIAANADQATREQIGQLQRMAMLRLSTIAEFGPRETSDGGWIYQQEARAMLNEIVFIAPNATERAARQTLADQMAARARNWGTGVGVAMQEVRSMLSSPQRQFILGAGDAAEATQRVQNLMAIAQNVPAVRNADTATLLIQTLSDYRNGQFGPWTPTGDTFRRMEEQLGLILRNESMDRRVSLAAAIHVLTSANPSPFSQAVTNNALDAIVRLSNLELQANPLWRREAQHYVNLILTNPAYARYRDYINQAGRAEALRPVQRPVQ